MSQIKKVNVERIQGYHAHIYFGPSSVDQARELRGKIEENFEISMGRFHEKEVGPHPRWSYQVAFGPELFARLVPWLAVNRAELLVFIHGISGDDLYDHTALAMWLGESLPLKLEIFG